MLLPVTFTVIAIMGIALIPLTGWVGLKRGATGILRGDGGDEVLFKRIRIYGNLMEVLPITLLSLGAAEAAGLDATWLWCAVAVFVAGRVLHFVLYDSTLRGGGMLVTVLPAVGLGVWLLIRVWGA